MRQIAHQHIYQYRKRQHLNLKDVAYLLNIDEGNLSRFETGKSQNPKALLGYHILFDLSIDNSILNLFYDDSENIVHRCFQLLEQLENKSNTKKNRLRTKGVNAIIRKLSKTDDEKE